MTAEEAKLQQLIRANAEGERAKWAQAARKQGKKVIGIMCAYIPTEVVYAAGMLPWRVTGTWTSNVHPLVPLHRPVSTDPFYSHILDARLKGELDFLDGAVFTNRDDDMRRLHDVWVYACDTPFSRMIFLPYHARESARRLYRDEITGLVKGLEKLGGRQITNEALLAAIQELNETRRLLTALYQLRKRARPALTGAEVLGITTAAQVMPADEFNSRLAALMPYLAERTVNAEGARLMLSSDALDNPAFVRLIEDSGAMVVMDDMDTGSRWFWQEVDMTAARQDPLKALADRYLTRPACPRMSNWDEQIAQAISWAKEFDVKGVIDFTQPCNYPRQFRVPLFRKALQEAGIPTLSLDRDYVLPASGQLKTRVEAFIEMLSTVKS